jgi:hypothetical protein
MKRIFKSIRSNRLFGFAVIIFKWLFKGLFGIYFILFWLWLLLAIGMISSLNRRIYDHRTGAEVWE